MPPRVRRGKVRVRRTRKTKTANYYPRKHGGAEALEGPHKGKRVSIRDYEKDRSIKAKSAAMPKGYQYRTDKTRPKKTRKRRKGKKK